MDDRPDDAARSGGALESAYLAARDVYGGSGFRGDAARWRAGREAILDGVAGSGSFLDIGCANGLLLESLVTWGAERGVAIEPYGIDRSAALVALARTRLPAWADRIAIGDGRTWRPRDGHRFDAVRTELGYVESHERQSFAQRLLDELVAPGGRLIVCSYLSTRKVTANPPAPEDELASWGWTVTGTARAVDPWTGKAFTRVAWLEPGS